MTTFVCAACGREVPNIYDRFRLRLEAVRLDGRERAAVRTVRLVGRCCAEAAVNGEAPEQARLL